MQPIERCAAGVPHAGAHACFGPGEAARRLHQRHAHCLALCEQSTLAAMSASFQAWLHREGEGAVEPATEGWLGD